MKKTLVGIGVAALLATSLNASLWSDFFNNNPSNQWDVTAYGLNNVSTSQLDISRGWGGGARVGYWISPSVGASLDFNYCDSRWTFGSLALTARGTINLGSLGSVSPYVLAGPGYSFQYSNPGGVSPQEVVAIAGSGATLHFNAIKWCDFMGEYVHITTKPEAQNQVRFGITKRF